MVYSQDEYYLSTRIKPGDICYRDGGGQERFIGYRDWDMANPPGTPLGVVCFSFYGPYPPGTDGATGWHGWLVELGESDSCMWAPETSPCYNNCVANYVVAEVNTPYNPNNYYKHQAMADTCGWQNTYRMLEYIYTGQGAVLNNNISPILCYIFAEKNGVSDFTTKPSMQHHSWYLPALGQLRLAYGEIGAINQALAACGGSLMLRQDSWHSSSELISPVTSAWGMNGRGIITIGNMAKKNRYKKVKAMRDF